MSLCNVIQSKDLTVKQLIKPIEFTASFSKPWLVKCNDDQQYVLKFFNGSDDTLANEFLCNRIAQVMGLTVPEIAVVSIEKENVQRINVNRKNLNEYQISPGKYFGTRFIDSTYTLEHEIYRKLKPSTIKNTREVPGMIVFDIFIQNIDRLKQNVLIHMLPKRQLTFEYVLIDHGHCFGGSNWNVNTMKDFQFDLLNIHWKHDLFIYDSQFKDYVEKLQNLDKRFFKEVIDEIPVEWKKQPHECNEFVNALSSMNASKILPLLKKHKRELLVKNLRTRIPKFDQCLSFIDDMKNKYHDLAN